MTLGDLSDAIDNEGLENGDYEVCLIQWSNGFVTKRGPSEKRLDIRY